MVNKKTINLNNARADKQIEVMKKILLDGVCPFCIPHLSKYHKNPTLKEGKYWLITENQWPYDGSDLHIILISKKHVELPSKLNPNALKELFELIEWLRKIYKVAGVSLIMRFGDTNLTGATISHLHCHFVKGVTRPKKTLKHPDDFITTIIGYKKKK